MVILQSALDRVVQLLKPNGRQIVRCIAALRPGAHLFLDPLGALSPA